MERIHRPHAPEARDDVATRLCTALDGVPLAIELAAAATVVLSLDELDDRLRAGSVDLRSRDRDRDPRHRSLHATAEWSVGLLAPIERDLFLRLSVFSSSFTIEQARAVAGSQPEKVLAALVDKSLVLREESDGMRSRVALHSWIRDDGARRRRHDPREAH